MLYNTHQHPLRRTLVRSVILCSNKNFYMKKLLFCLLINMCLCFIAQAQKLDCNKYHNGTFKIKATEDFPEEVTIERHGSEQTETTGSGFKASFYVKWIDDCTYTLQLKKIINNPQNLQFPADTIVTVSITEIHSHGYYQISGANNSTTTFKSEVIVVE